MAEPKKKPPYATESELFARPAYKWMTREEIDRGYHPAKAARIAREREKRIKELNQNTLGNPKGLRDLENNSGKVTKQEKANFKATKPDISNARKVLESEFKKRKGK